MKNKNTKTAVVEVAVKKQGRPVNPNSNRQQMLAFKSEQRALGLVKRGRPVNGESKRQAELARKSELRELGMLTGMKGRPVNTNSKRQQVLALRESGERRKPGRPKMVKQDAE
jgi:hypothetical protein